MKTAIYNDPTLLQNSIKLRLIVIFGGNENNLDNKAFMICFVTAVNVNVNKSRWFLRSWRLHRNQLN